MEANKTAIEKHRHELAELVRQYCRAQLAAWREVPYWAWMADGRGGWSSTYSQAAMGYWDILAEGRGWEWMLVVNLATGEIQNGTRPASDAEVAPLAFKLERLDAAGIVEGLMREAQKSSHQGWSEDELATYKSRYYSRPPRPFKRRGVTAAV
jgi:hypothetical protein